MSLPEKVEWALIRGINITALFSPEMCCGFSNVLSLLLDDKFE